MKKWLFKTLFKSEIWAMYEVVREKELQIKNLKERIHELTITINMMKGKNNENFWN